LKISLVYTVDKNNPFDRTLHLGQNPSI